VPGSVLILEDDEDLVDAMRDALRDEEWSCVAAHSMTELEELGTRLTGCDLAILDINLGADVPSGIDAYRWLRQRRFGGRILFLTGHARSHPLVQEAGNLEGAQVLQKPLALDRLLTLIGGTP
jgi:DNA-binding response OmpR family regulator